MGEKEFTPESVIDKGFRIEPNSQGNSQDGWVICSEDNGEKDFVKRLNILTDGYFSDGNKADAYFSIMAERNDDPHDNSISPESLGNARKKAELVLQRLKDPEIRRQFKLLNNQNVEEMVLELGLISKDDEMWDYFKENIL